MKEQEYGFRRRNIAEIVGRTLATNPSGLCRCNVSVIYKMGQNCVKRGKRVKKWEELRREI